MWFGVGHANVVGADTQNFNPTTNGLDFVTVHSSETLKPGVFNAGFFLNYAINTLPNYVDVTTQSRTNFRDSLFSSDLSFGLGLMNNWDIGVSFPQVHSQSLDTDVASAKFSSTGLTEIRANTKFRFYGDDSGGMAVVASANFNRIENNPFVGSDAGPTFNLEVAADTTIDKYALGANLGYRFRSSGSQIPNVPVEPMKDQFIGSVAASYLFTSWDTKLITELFGSFPTKNQKNISDREISSLEFLLGLKTDVTQNLALHVGGGTEVFHGSASPDWRVYTGVNWALGPLFSAPRQNIVKKRKSVQELDYDNTEETIDPFEGMPTETEETFFANDILFDFGSDQLSAEFNRLLLIMADYLNRGDGFKSVVIEGHTDSIGKASYNLQLSQNRARNVRKFLVQKAGLPANKIKAVGYGEAYPIADNGNFQGRARNRRVEFKVIR